MGFIVFCVIIAAIIQLVILNYAVGKYQIWRYLSLLLIEVFPLGGACYTYIVKPSVPYLGWEFEAVLYLWVAGGVLTGYIIAWGIYGILNSGNEEK